MLELVKTILLGLLDVAFKVKSESPHVFKISLKFITVSALFTINIVAIVPERNIDVPAWVAIIVVIPDPIIFTILSLIEATDEFEL